MNRNWIVILILLFLFFINPGLNAQSTNPSPYCYPTATAMTSGTCTGSGGPKGYGFCFESLSLNGMVQTSKCYGSGNTDLYRYWSATTSLKQGDKNMIVITTPQSIAHPNPTANLLIYAGVWIDLNQNNYFESTELLGTSSDWYGYRGGGYIQLSFTIACGVKTGKTRMRVRVQDTTVAGKDSCSSSRKYGETWDFDVTILKGSTGVVGFSAPSQGYIKSPMKFINNNKPGSGYISHKWQGKNINDSAWGPNISSLDYSVTTNTPGAICVRLKSTNCYGTDSVAKCVTIITPTAKPVADFTVPDVCNRVIDIFGQVDLIDMSSNGPYIWKWKIYDSVTYKKDPYDKVSDEWSGYVNYSNGTSSTSRNPSVEFYRNGTYTVELIATNVVGASVVAIKRSLIKVAGYYDYLVGAGSYGSNLDNRIVTNSGMLTDEGGNANNYINNTGLKTKSFLIINPPAALPIKLSFEQVRLSDVYDSIIVYDDDKINKSKILGVLTSDNNGTYPTFTSTTNKMYFYFSADKDGTDSGYLAYYANDDSYNYYRGKKQKIAIGNNVVFVNGKSVFFNEYENIKSFNYNKTWWVNDTIQTAFNDKDTLKYKFRYAGSQKVCLELKGCDTTIKSCKNVSFEQGVMGIVYKDNNVNCIFDTGDLVVRNVRIKLFDSTLKTWTYCYTGAGGEYNFSKGPGIYKVAIDTFGIPFKVKCGNPGIESIYKLTTSNPLKFVNYGVTCKSGNDLGVRSVWTNGAVFPGKNHELRINAGDMNKWFGLNCTSGVNGSVVVSVSGKVTYLNKVPGSLTPSSISGNVFTYTISDFSAINGVTDFGLEFKTDPNAKTGDPICVNVSVSPSAGDNNISNNDVNFCYKVVNSTGSNMKEVYPEEITYGYKDWLTYTVHFQNTGNVPANDIQIADTLDSKLDLLTFQLLNYSHPVIPGLKNNVLSFMFKGIMLPDSNSNEKASHGFVQYRIKPKANLPKGAVIKNRALVNFDLNNPVATNTVENEIYPKYVVIPDTNFAVWLSAKYPGCMRKVNLMDTSCSDIKNATDVNVDGKDIANLFGIQFFTSLKNLDCSNNKLSGLPELPATVKQFICAVNKFVNLPVLPSGLTELGCPSNNLDSLPALPASLQSLSCGFNKLDKLPSLPASLTILSCDNNQLSSLPVLPAGLKELYCNDNKIICFEKFSEGLNDLDIGGNNHKCLPNHINAMDAITKAVPLCIKGDAINNPGNCTSTVPPTVLIPDVNFAAWLNAEYPGYIYNGNLLDTSCSGIKKEINVDVSGKSIADLFGIQFFVSLKILDCSDNKLTGLQGMPGTVTDLNCADNKMTGLPVLSNQLSKLVCDNNMLASLPSLPGALIMLNCADNAIDELPILPSGLQELYCNDNDIACFGKFSDNISAIDISGNKYKCLPNYITAMDAATKATALCINDDSINNPDKCLSTLQISVKQIKSFNDFHVYPNPGKGLFNVEIPENLKGGDVKIEVYNALGSLIVTAFVKDDVVLVDISTQPNGIYMLKLIAGDVLLGKFLIKE